MVSTTPKVQRQAPGSDNAADMFVEIRGEATADLRSLASVGVCARCATGMCTPIPAYLRISADRFDDAALLSDLKADRGVVRQAQKMIALVEEETAHVILFVDNDLSASKKRKEAAEWWKALDYVRDEKPPKLLGVKHDRLGRRMADLEDLEDTCRESGNTRVITLADGDLFANPAWPFLAAMAKTEARNTSFRVKLAQASRRSKGLDSGGGIRPFGYAIDRMTIVESEADVIRHLMVPMFLDGVSGLEIANRLNADGITRSAGNKWDSQRVRKTLRNPRYAGYRTEDGVVVGEGAWPALIDKKTYELIIARMDDTAISKRGGRPMSSLLGGVARCGYCETPLYAGSTTTDKGATLRLTYRCTKESGGCGKIHRSRQPIEDFVISEALSLVNADVSANQAAAARERVELLESRRMDLDWEVKNNSDEYGSLRLDAGSYYKRRDALAAQARDLDKEWRAAVEELDELSDETTAGGMWESWTLDKRRRFLRSKLAAVLVYRAKSRGAAARVLQPGEVKIIPR